MIQYSSRTLAREFEKHRLISHLVVTVILAEHEIHVTYIVCRDSCDGGD